MCKLGKCLNKYTHLPGVEGSLFPPPASRWPGNEQMDAALLCWTCFQLVLSVLSMSFACQPKDERDKGKAEVLNSQLGEKQASLAHSECSRLDGSSVRIYSGQHKPLCPSDEAVKLTHS